MDDPQTDGQPCDGNINEQKIVNIAQMFQRFRIEQKCQTCQNATKERQHFHQLIAYTLAFGHFFFEKNYGLKDLKAKIERYKDKEETENTKIKLGSEKKHLIVSLADGHLEVHDNVQWAKPLEPRNANYAGTKDREYANPVIKCTLDYDRDNLRPYYIADSPSCLLTVGHLVSHGVLTLTSEEKNFIYKSFGEMLQFLLDEEESCENFYVVVCSKSPLLYKILENGVDKEKLELPKLETFDYTGIGGILAYQYFFNYLVHVLPSLKERMVEWEEDQHKNQYWHGSKNFIHKMICVAPKSGYCPGLLEDRNFNNCIDVVGNLKELEIIHEHGIGKRTYKSTVYKILNPNGKKEPYYCIGEYAPPVLQIYNMYKECPHYTCYSQFKNIYKQEIHKFVKTSKALVHENNYDDLVSFIEFDGKNSVEDKNNNISLCKVLYDTLEWEKNQQTEVN